MTLIYNEVIRLITMYLTPKWIEESKVEFSPETTFKYLEFDVLDEVEVSLLVEKRFNIDEIPNDMEWFLSIEDLVKYIKERV